VSTVPWQRFLMEYWLNGIDMLEPSGMLANSKSGGILFELLEDGDLKTSLLCSEGHRTMT
jgi:hypothetical protein